MKRERVGHTLQATALGNEAYLRLIDVPHSQWQSHAHFFATVARVVEMRFFGGLSLEETAEALRVSRDRIKRDWKIAKLWLLRELRCADRDDL